MLRFLFPFPLAVNCFVHVAILTWPFNRESFYGCQQKVAWLHLGLHKFLAVKGICLSATIQRPMSARDQAGLAVSCLASPARNRFAVTVPPLALPSLSDDTRFGNLKTDHACSAEVPSREFEMKPFEIVHWCLESQIIGVRLTRINCAIIVSPIGT